MAESGSTSWLKLLSTKSRKESTDVAPPSATFSSFAGLLREVRGDPDGDEDLEPEAEREAERRTGRAADREREAEAELLAFEREVERAGEREHTGVADAARWATLVRRRCLCCPSRC
mmetsp:Transcript_117842/g.380308  ORF Transcript_117842/g.380308 Transcript_117842/m.380308 type:complete len:117 (-) Transcript_117842:107-457(-)